MTKLKLIRKYLFIFIISLLVMLGTTLIILKVTVFNEKYVINLLNKDNYFEVLNKEINQKMIENIPSSGFDNSILENIYTETDLIRDVESLIANFYHNDKLIVRDNQMRNNLINNINKYLKNNNIKDYNQKDINNYIEEMLNIYKDNLLPINYLSEGEKIFNTINISLTIVLILLILNIGIILIYKRKEIIKYFIISLSFTTFIYLFIYFYIIIKVDINHLIILNNATSSLFKEIINNTLNIFLFVGIIYFIIFILLNFIPKKK